MIIKDAPFKNAINRSLNYFARDIGKRKQTVSIDEFHYLPNAVEIKSGLPAPNLPDDTRQFPGKYPDFRTAVILNDNLLQEIRHQKNTGDFYASLPGGPNTVFIHGIIRALAQIFSPSNRPVQELSGTE